MIYPLFSFKKITLLLFYFLFFVSCNETKKSNSEKSKFQNNTTTSFAVNELEIVNSDKRLFDTLIDGTACILAGKPSYNSDFEAIEKSKIWKKYVIQLDTIYQRAFKKRYNKIADWSDAMNIKQEFSTNKLFYPFSGPDVLNALTMFPLNNEYIMIGLEPIGKIPNILSNVDSIPSSYYNHIHNSLTEIMHCSFFCTNKMKVQLDTSKINGVLPIILLFLKRFDNTILKVENIDLDSSGAVQLSNYKINQANSHVGVKITFSDSNQTTLRTIQYFSINLNDTFCKKNTKFINYLNQQKPINTFIKSASYLMHYPNFSTIRNYILENSVTILQDDTGIPIKYFEPTNWQVNLFGRYANPVKPFPEDKFYQNDLALMYKDSSIAKLPFPYGYHAQISKSNLAFIKKSN